MNFLNQKEWNAESSVVWKEIVARWGEDDYYNETKRAEHQATLKAEYDSKQYARDRAEAYPSIADQLDALWHSIDKGEDLILSDFYTANKTVKDANPKPSE